MLFDRQKRLLELLEALGGEIGNLDFQKLLFLYCKEVESSSPAYEFVPYRFGGFSFTSYADKRRLIERGLLVDEDRTWKLGTHTQNFFRLPPKIRVKIRTFAKQRASLRGDDLVAEVYRRYPYYATRSEMAARLFAKEPKAYAAIQAARPKTSSAGISTIGYEGLSLEGYLNKLLHAGVTLLCDVRRNPLSRKYGFSKNTLQKACEGVGIIYEHIPELGISTEERRGLTTQADYDALFSAYTRDSLPNQSHALAKISEWVNKGHYVALTCYEASHCQCHRHCVSDALEREFGVTFIASHL